MDLGFCAYVPLKEIIDSREHRLQERVHMVCNNA